MQQFEPLREQINVSKNQVKYFSQLLSSVDINGRTPVGTPHYDIENLAEELLGNLVQFKNLERFRECLELFSLRYEVSKGLIRVVETNFEEIVTLKVNSIIKIIENNDIESVSSDPSDCSRNVALLLF